MYKSLALFSVLAAVAAANAQSATGPQTADPQQPAPIVRRYVANQYAPMHPYRSQDQVVESQPVAGVWLRSESSSALKTITATPQHTEIRLDRGRLNVSVHHPAQHAEILVDLPGGQVSLFKDGLYTFNADTNTIRVLRGEAAAYPGPIATNSNSKPIKIKEDHQLSLVVATDAKPLEIRSVESYPYELTADLLPFNNDDRGYGDRGYSDGYEYGDGYPPYYAGAYGYPGFYPGYYGYGYPYDIGLGFGYYGGFGGGHYGGFRGGFRR